MTWNYAPELKVLDFLPDRILAKIDVDQSDPDCCWLWTGFATDSGYSQVWTGERLIGLHRWVALEVHGWQPVSMDAGHACHDRASQAGLCRPSPVMPGCPHRLCCNPAHIAWQSPRENLLGSAWTQASRMKKRGDAQRAQELLLLSDWWAAGVSEQDIEINRTYAREIAISHEAAA
ncbi:hypothetical protein ACIGG9_16175 [Pseudonocardia alni]|uniref:hypothetical protein n=1 Tax=Pseudonocardia alni TaxID=33907 RepID=UPI00340B9921